MNKLAEREGIYISQLPESTSLTDNMLFATDNGADNNSVSAANLAEYVNKKIDVAGQVNNGVSEANSYTDTKKTEAVTEAKSYADTKKTEAVQVSMALAAATFSNPNLLINGDFQVWQRGESFTASGYTADRWYAYMSGSGNSVSHANGGITIDTTSGNLIQFQQFFEEAEFKKLKGKTVTLSINIEIIQGSVAVYSNVDTLKQIGSISASGIHKFTFTVAENISSFKILFSFLAGRKAVIKWVKLELGEVSTPFVPRTYAEELAMCQRYYQVLNKYSDPYYELGMTAGKGNTTLYLLHHLPTEMRIAPTITALGTWRVDTGNTRVANINTISATADANKPTTAGLTVTTDNNITKDAYVTIKAYGNANSRITLDAEIY